MSPAYDSLFVASYILDYYCRAGSSEAAREWTDGAPRGLHFAWNNKFIYCRQIQLSKRKKRSLKEIGSTFVNGGKDKSNVAAELLRKFASSAKTVRRCWASSDFQGNNCWSSERKEIILNVGNEK